METRRETEQMFDRWVQESLRERYAQALREPLPEALMRLLDAADPQASPAAK